MRCDSISEAASSSMVFLQCGEVLFPEIKFCWGLFWVLITCEKFYIREVLVCVCDGDVFG